jgi:hypothetical protein
MSSVAIEFFKTIDQSQIKLVKHELQFDFWQSINETEVERLIRMTEEIKLSTNKVRKGTYAEICFLKKEVAELKATVEILVRHICHN